LAILSRFRDIMSSNVNALLDKMEDPAKMVDQLLLNLNDDLNKVKAETAGVMATETRARRALDECNEEIGKLTSYAEKAVLSNNDDDARRFLTKKSQLESNKVQLQTSYDVAADNALKMRQMHDKLVSQIDELNGRRQTIKAKVAVAKTQDRVNKIESKIGGAAANMDAFSRMEERADKMLDTANAMTELNQAKDTMDDLTKKYDSAEASTSVEDELAALKATLGK